MPQTDKLTVRRTNPRGSLHFVYTREPKRAEGGTIKAKEKQTIGKGEKKAESYIDRKRGYY